MILFNDASLHGQFLAVEPFKESLRVLWDIRKALIAKGLQLRVCRSVRLRQVTPTETFNDFLGAIPNELRIRLLLWLDREGPFWDDGRQHSGSEYFQCYEEPVTDTGAAEAACFVAAGGASWLFSLDPSSFLADPLVVEWLDRKDGDLHLSIPNGWTSEHAERCASTFERPFLSWDELLKWAEIDCGNLLLSEEIRSQLPPQFIPSVAQRSRVLLAALNEIVGYMKEGSSEALEGMREVWMHGDSAPFSPSSRTEIRDHKADLTFRSPQTGESVFCSWHGKINTPKMRIHFEWPLPDGETRLFVPYIGPKLTKK